MNRDKFNHRQDGLQTIGGMEMYDFVQERYYNLLREAEQYRLERRILRPRPSASLQVVSQPLTLLLSWAKLRWATLTHAA